jgi:hypothetical protein
MAMSISKDEAVAALRDVEGAQARAMTARAYLFGAPHLILWGVVWVIGYSLSGLLPGEYLNRMWLILSLAGIVGSTVVGFRARRKAHASGGHGANSNKLWFVSFIAVWLFIIATYVVMRPHDTAQFEVFPGLVLGLIYVQVGLWRLPRYIGIGAAVFLLSMAGFLFFQPVLSYWMAAVGGGGLILGGFWLRQP